MSIDQNLFNPECECVEQTSVDFELDPLCRGDCRINRGAMREKLASLQGSLEGGDMKFFIEPMTSQLGYLGQLQ